MALALAAPSLGAAARPSVADQLRAIERSRLEALVKEDADTIARLTADDYQLVSPLGTIDTRADELRGLPRGFYVALDPGPMAVRLGGPNSAILRYRVDAMLKIGGRVQPPRHFWHIDYYERRHGRWQVVWSQSTEIRDPAPRPPG
jgi:hypothetical protein